MIAKTSNSPATSVRHWRLSTVVAFIGVLIVFWQLRVMQDQLKDAADSARMQDESTRRALEIADRQAAQLSSLVQALSANERARLYIQRVFIANPSRKPVPGEHLVVVLHFGNWGRTAAEHSAANVKLELLPKGRHPKTIQTKGEGDFLVAPQPAATGYSMDVQLTVGGSPAGPLSPASAESIIKGDRVLVLHGRMDYVDYAGTSQGMPFCRAYLPNVPNSETNGTGDWWDCGYLGFKYSSPSE